MTPRRAKRCAKLHEVEAVHATEGVEVARLKVDGGWLYVTRLFHLQYGRFRGQQFFATSAFVPARILKSVKGE